MNELISLKAEDGNVFEVYMSKSKSKEKGYLIVLQEIFGVNEHIKEVTENFASNGWTAMAPFLFDRAKKNVQLGYSEQDIQEGLILKKNCEQNSLLDIEACFNYLKNHGRVGVVGYCWGGSLSWKAACNIDGLFASVAYYGGEIPKLINLNPKCPVLTHFGKKDHGIPVKDVLKFEEKQKDVKVFYYNADHGFNCNYRNQYDKESANLALDRTLSFFNNK